LVKDGIDSLTDSILVRQGIARSAATSLIGCIINGLLPVSDIDYLVFIGEPHEDKKKIESLIIWLDRALSLWIQDPQKRFLDLSIFINTIRKDSAFRRTSNFVRISEEARTLNA